MGGVHRYLALGSFVVLPRNVLSLDKKDADAERESAAHGIGSGVGRWDVRYADMEFPDVGHGGLGALV